MKKAHGLYSVMGNFGGGKTFGTFLDLYKLDKNENYIIANVPYSRVDLFFSTKEQLFQIIDDLEKYCQDTNYDIEKYFNDLGNLKNLILVVDEAHLYFPARGWKEKGNLWEKIAIIVSQCRKRRIKIFIISQRLKTVDLNFRRLSDFIIQYKKRSFMGFIKRCHRSIYENEGDIADIQGDEQKSYVVAKDGKSGPDAALLHKELFYPLTTFFNIFSKRDKAYQDISQEPYNSLFISGLKIQNGFKRFDPEQLRKTISEQKKISIEQAKREAEKEDIEMVTEVLEPPTQGTEERTVEQPKQLETIVASSSHSDVSPFIIKNQDDIPIYNSNYRK